MRHVLKDSGIQIRHQAAAVALAGAAARQVFAL